MMSRAEIRIKARRLLVLRAYLKIGDPEVSPLALSKQLGISATTLRSDLDALGLSHATNQSRDHNEVIKSEAAYTLPVDAFIRNNFARATRNFLLLPKLDVPKED